jgi:SanA protein
MYNYRMKRAFTFIGLGFALVFIFILAINAVVYLYSKPYIYSDPTQAPSAEAALIPGAGILANGTPSPILLDRVNMAINLYEAGKVSKILVSGANNTVTNNEVNPVRNYLVSKGIPSEDVFLDHAGFDTYSSMYRAKDIFEVSSIIITSQSFHLPRAVFIARELGIQAYGVRSDAGPVSYWNYVREVFADEKAVFDLVFHIQPKYLGNPIPITGDGND